MIATTQSDSALGGADRDYLCGVDSQTTLLRLLLDAPDLTQVAIRGDGEVLSWGTLRNRVRHWLHALAAHPAERYAVYLHDAFECLAALYAVWAIRRCAILPADVKPATCKALSTSSDLFLGDFPQIFDPVRPDDEWCELPAHLPHGVTPMLEVFTSGSTGAPVGIGKSLRQLDAEARVLERQWGTLVERSHVIATVPHQHMYGLLFKLVWPVVTGRVFRVEQALYPEWVIGWLPAGQRTTLVTSPAFIKRMADHQGWEATHGKCALLISAGGVLPTDDGERAAHLVGAQVREIYGSTETGALACRRAGIEDEPWSPLPGVRTDFSTDVPRFSAPHMPNPEKWHRFPDNTEASGCGFRLLGRPDRIAKVEDRRVSLDAVEALLAAHAAVSECRVVVLNRRKTLLGAAIIPRDADSVTGDESLQDAIRKQLHACAADSLDPVAVPRLWRFVRQFPIDSMGKTTAAELSEMFEA